MTARPSGIVLAGGRSTRFGADKLAATLHGRPLLHRPIAALETVCAEVILVVGHEGIPPLPALRVPLRIVRDDDPGAGPLAALVSGLREVNGDVALVVAGDMPGLVPGLLADLATRAAAPDRDAAILLDGDRLRPLPSAVRCAAAIEAGGRLRDAGEGRLRALFDCLRVDRVAELMWRPLDPDGTSLLDVDRPEDLERARSLD